MPAVTDTGKYRGARGGGEECTGHNEVVLTVCLHQEESTCGALETYGGEGGEMNVAQLRSFFSFFSCFLVSKVAKVLRFAVFQTFCFFVFVLFLMNSTFSFPLCCNVGSHGSNFDVLKVLFPTHICH